jgi:hypothetical protein
MAATHAPVVKRRCVDDEMVAVPLLAGTCDDLFPCRQTETGNFGGALLNSTAMLVGIGADHLDFDHPRASFEPSVFPGVSGERAVSHDVQAALKIVRSYSISRMVAGIVHRL